MTRPKRLYRVVATRSGTVVFQRDYQSRGAAQQRCDRLRDQMKPDSITIAESDIVTWSGEDRGAP